MTYKGLAKALQVFAIICSAMMIAAVDAGLGRHPYYLKPEAVSKADKLSLILEPFGVIAFSLPKLAVAIVLIQIMPPNKWKAWFLYCLTGSQILSAVITCVLLFTQCLPTRALWTPALLPTATCIRPALLVNYTIFVGCK